MSVVLTIRDETTGGDTLREFALELLTESVTVRELIRSRVYQEVQDYNLRKPQPARGLVELTPAERTLNDSRSGRTIDWKPQFERAVRAFGG